MAKTQGWVEAARLKTSNCAPSAVWRKGKSVFRFIYVRFILHVYMWLYYHLSKAPLPNFGKGSTGRPRIVSDGQSLLTVGKYCSISHTAVFLLGLEHKPEWLTTYPFSLEYAEFHGQPYPIKSKGDIVVGNDVWIGYQAMILSGVHIGDGAVIGARTVVARDVPPYAVVVGNPARIIRYRFNPKVITELLTLKWWDKPDEWIKQNIPMLLSENFDALLCQTDAEEPNPQLQNRAFPKTSMAPFAC